MIIIINKNLTEIKRHKDAHLINQTKFGAGHLLSETVIVSYCNEAWFCCVSFFSVAVQSKAPYEQGTVWALNERQLLPQRTKNQNRLIIKKWKWTQRHISLPNCHIEAFSYRATAFFKGKICLILQSESISEISWGIFSSKIPANMLCH